MPVHVRRHLDRSVPETGLHHHERQFEPSVGEPVDVPRGVEMAEAVEAGIFGLAVAVYHTGRDLRWMEAAFDDRVAMLDASSAVGKDEIELILGAGKAVFSQGRDQHRRQWHGALARR